jgi:hypothetical protein
VSPEAAVLRRPYKDGFIDSNDEDAHSVNSLTGTSNDNRAFIIDFSEEPGIVNHLPIAEGLYCKVCFYRPRGKFLDSAWTLRQAKLVTSK